ncbi:type III-B CRISPR module-associated protein Cmr5 [Halomonas sp.]|uniref:type III-B CRISPR module-associated protein Cmr5 n=1 Tax=Halomonas sp. TaxID=1486246 RepID=UPI00384DBBA6
MSKKKPGGKTPKHDKPTRKQTPTTPMQVSVGVRGASASASVPSAKASAKDSPVPSKSMLIEQARAAHALKWIQQANGAIKQSERSELKSFTRRLPGMIQVNGFGQAVAFYYAKQGKSEAYRSVYSLVESWLCGPHAHESVTGTPLFAAYAEQAPALLTAITNEDQHRYRLAQAETQALLRWAKKFAEALVADEADVTN